MFGSEISNLPALGAVQRLQPQVVHTIVADGIDDSLSVACEPQQPESRTLEFHQLCRLAARHIQKREHFPVLAGMLQRGKRGDLAIGREVKDAGNGQVREDL